MIRAKRSWTCRKWWSSRRRWRIQDMKPVAHAVIQRKDMEVVAEPTITMLSEDPIATATATSKITASFIVNEWIFFVFFIFEHRARKCQARMLHRLAIDVDCNRNGCINGHYHQRLATVRSTTRAELCGLAHRLNNKQRADLRPGASALTGTRSGMWWRWRWRWSRSPREPRVIPFARVGLLYVTLRVIPFARVRVSVGLLYVTRRVILFARVRPSVGLKYEALRAIQFARVRASDGL